MKTFPWITSPGHFQVNSINIPILQMKKLRPAEVKSHSWQIAKQVIQPDLRAGGHPGCTVYLFPKTENDLMVDHVALTLGCPVPWKPREGVTQGHQGWSPGAQPSKFRHPWSVGKTQTPILTTLISAVFHHVISKNPFEVWCYLCKDGMKMRTPLKC